MTERVQSPIDAQHAYDVLGQPHPPGGGCDQDGQVGHGTPERGADLIAFIREHHRRRCDMHRAEKALTLRIKAVCRRFCDGDLAEAGKLYKALFSSGVAHPQAPACAAWVAPLVAARAAVADQRKVDERAMEKAARKLLVWAWASGVRGLGPLSLAQLVGEAGDIGSYGGPAKLWKRMGLAVMSGVRQGGLPSSAKAEEWVAHGYNRERRSLAFVIGDNLIRAGNVEYRAIYEARKAYELARDPEMKPLHAHRRAKRYMEKRLLRELWRAWRAAVRDPAPLEAAPPAGN